MYCSVLQCVAVSFTISPLLQGVEKVMMQRAHHFGVRNRYATVYCSVLQCVAVCCNVLQCVAVCCSVFHHQPVVAGRGEGDDAKGTPFWRSKAGPMTFCTSVSSLPSTVLQCIAVCCSVPHFVACVPVFQVFQVMCCSVLQCVAVCRIVLSVYQCFKSSKYCVAVCCSMLQYVAVCFRVSQ